LLALPRKCCCGCVGCCGAAAEGKEMDKRRQGPPAEQALTFLALSRQCCGGAVVLLQLLRGE
jgi:hypothetical protein